MSRMLLVLVFPLLLACPGSKEDDTAATTDTTTTPVAATCADYCTTYFANCATQAATDYVDQAGCESACAPWPQGEPGATTGNTLECRVYHADAAADDAATHCPHAGAVPTDACID